MRPPAGGFRCRILDNGLFVLNLSGSCGSVMTHLSPTGEWFTHSSLLSHSNSLRKTSEGARYIWDISVTSLSNWWQQSLSVTLNMPFWNEGSLVGHFNVGPSIQYRLYSLIFYFQMKQVSLIPAEYLTPDKWWILMPLPDLLLGYESYSMITGKPTYKSE